MTKTTQEKGRTTYWEDGETQAELTPEQQEILKALKNAKGTNERVKRFATLMDRYLMDTAIGGLFPAAGDIATSLSSLLYLLTEAIHIDMAQSEKNSIINFQTKDVAYGAIPWVDLIFDTFYKANQKSIPLFLAKLDELTQKAQAANIPAEHLKEIKELEKLLPLIKQTFKILLKREAEASLKDKLKNLQSELRTTFSGYYKTVIAPKFPWRKKLKKN